MIVGLVYWVMMEFISSLKDVKSFDASHDVFTEISVALKTVCFVI